MFDYDQTTPPQVKIVAEGAAKIKDITYTSPVDGAPTRAYLVLPVTADAPAPAVLYAHWYDTHAPDSNRSQFIAEAVTLAGEGVASMLVETMWSLVPWFSHFRKLDTDYQASVKQVIELRAALNVLLAQPEVDSERVAFVGHDFGAMYGTLLASVEPRLKGCVLIAGTPRFPDWYLLGTKLDEDAIAAYKAHMQPLDPIEYIGKVSMPLLFQFGSQDRFIPEAAAREFYNAARDPKQFRLYEGAEHDMGSVLIQEDRLVFLREVLRISQPAAV
jgi:dienelactone hydrolase